jgi:4-hydroxy-2-oxoheptanedioate aldolase
MSVLPANDFKRLLSSRERTYGLWSSIADPTIAEILSLAGADWILLDLEHTAASVADALAIARTSLSCPLVVRTSSSSRTELKRVLDTGIQSVLIPQIAGVEEARAAIAACRYPPLGVRGVAASTRAAAYGTRAGRLPDLEREVAVVLQIETVGAIDEIEDIARLDGLSGLLVGPADMAAAMGHIGNPMHEQVQETISQVLSVCKKAGVAAGIYAARPGSHQAYAAMGFDFIAVGHDTALLLAAAQDALAAARDGTA